jgi:hypothetical protein
VDFSTFQATISANAMRSAERWVYRGHAKPEWPLTTSYSRLFEELGANCGPFSLERFWRMLRRFIRSASEFAGTNYDAYSLVQKMAIAQHHHIPTPLLDWSHSPYVAVYFAAADNRDGNDRLKVCVHGINVGRLPVRDLPNEEQEAIRSDDDCFRFIDTNSFFSRRILRQMGCFTFQSFPGCLQDWCRSNRQIAIDFRQYEITGSRSRILSELALMGIRVERCSTISTILRRTS